VHAVLQDALFKACAQEAAASGISTNTVLAGKSGTAYDFTDTWFVGYSSAVTCGVWVGFDKPQKIYRGAFGKDLALPIWAQVMNASMGSFPSKSLTLPAGLKQVAICRSSGLLAAEGCRKLLGMVASEYATEAEMPTEPCDTHGGGVRSYNRDIDQAEWPRAAAAVDLTRVRPIPINAPTLLAQNDLYRSVNPTLSVGAAEDANIKVARATSPDGKDPGTDGKGGSTNVAVALPVGEKEVRKAEAVRPMDLQGAAPVMTIPAPKPAEF
jgi:penicillin-binding protein 1A